MYKLLIVDDEPLIRRGIKSLANLSDIGIGEIIEAQSGEEAIEMVEAHKPDLIIMDINMPQMDGLTASATIKERYPEIFIIILTGYDYFEYAQTAIRAKVDDYILKPISKTDIEIVLTKIVKLLNERNKQNEFEKLSVSEELIIEEGANNMTDLVTTITEYMKQNMYSPDHSLSKMASDIGFNSSYLSGIVKQIYGVPFQDYVNKKRMERAKLLLLSTPMKNYEVAESIGIEDVNYFVTKFKKAWGITPKQYRQGAQSNEN